MGLSSPRAIPRRGVPAPGSVSPGKFEKFRASDQVGRDGSFLADMRFKAEGRGGVEKSSSAAVAADAQEMQCLGLKEITRRLRGASAGAG